MPLPRLLCVATLAAAASCAGSNPAPSTTSNPAAAAPPSTPAGKALPLPPVPAVDGPLSIGVAYPAPNQLITSRDSNFIFGSIGSGKATLTVNGIPAHVAPNGAFLAWLANPADSRYVLVATRGDESVSKTLPIRLASASTAAPAAPPERKPESMPTSRADTVAALSSRIDSLRGVLARNDPIGTVTIGQATPDDTDRTIIARPVEAGTYKWFIMPGTQMSLVSRRGAYLRVRADEGLDVYVDTGTASNFVSGGAVERRTLSNMKVRGSRFGVDVVMPIGRRAPWFVEEGDHWIAITLYGVRGNTDIINYAGADSMVRTVEWTQVTNDRVRVTVNLRAPPFGYLVVWENNALVLKLRGRPAIDPVRPLAGLTIAVDPGHPPGGASGPTGLLEPKGTLPISVRLKRMLEERGATVLMTRTTDSAIALEDRPVIARRANVHAFVSIHLNAFPDGINPFTSTGTGAYFFRTHSEPLAREVQRGMLAQMGLPDLGVNYDNLAVVRGTWYPAVLCEGAFLMIPEWESALRTPEFQERYARGVADGVEAYFRQLSRQQ